MLGVIQGGSSLGFALETRECLGVAGNFLGQKLEGYKSVEPRVLGLIDHAHAAAQLLNNAVVRNGLPEHWKRILGG
jgi:hypothetical protein